MRKYRVHLRKQPNQYSSGCKELVELEDVFQAAGRRVLVRGTVPPPRLSRKVERSAPRHAKTLYTLCALTKAESRGDFGSFSVGAMDSPGQWSKLGMRVPFVSQVLQPIVQPWENQKHLSETEQAGGTRTYCTCLGILY